VHTLIKAEFSSERLSPRSVSEYSTVNR
jgi:hypothetical protein